MKNFILFQNVYKSQGGTVIKIYTIYPEIYDFYDEDETNYDIDEIDKENLNEFCNFTADHKPGNTKQERKYHNQTWCIFCGKKNE